MNVSEEVGHLYPLGDAHPHITDDSQPCVCNPVLTQIGDNDVMIHRSFDGREIIMPWKTRNYVHTVDVSSEFSPDTMSYDDVPAILEYTFGNFRKRGTIVCGVSLGKFQMRAYHAHMLVNEAHAIKIPGAFNHPSTVHGVPLYESPLENCVVIHYCLPTSIEDREVK